jgi:hypothetical protein
MADYAQTISLSDTKVGDRWVGISTIGPVTINGSTPGAALTRVRMTFRLGATALTLDSDDDEITIDDASSWTCSIAAMDDFLPRSGKWSWNMEFWGTGYNSPYTLYAGEIRVWDDVD